MDVTVLTFGGAGRTKTAPPVKTGMERSVGALGSEPGVFGSAIKIGELKEITGVGAAAVVAGAAAVGAGAGTGPVGAVAGGVAGAGLVVAGAFGSGAGLAVAGAGVSGLASASAVFAASVLAV